MMLADPAPRLDDPVDSLLRFHRRLERNLAAFGRLPLLIEVSGIGAEASATAVSLLHCFGPACDLHHAEEERDLMPRLETRIPLAKRDAWLAFRRGVERDHRELERLWRSLCRPLKAISEGLDRRLAAEEIHRFRAVWATHICEEEASLHFLALRHLLPRDRTVLAHRIRARRERGVRAA